MRRLVAIGCSVAYRLSIAIVFTVQSYNKSFNFEISCSSLTKTETWGMKTLSIFFH